MSLPQHRNCALGELGELRTGVQLRGAVHPDVRGEHRLIQLGDVRDDGIDGGALARMTLPRARPGDFLVSGDLLLRSRGSSYRAAVVTPELAGAVPVAPLYVLRLHSREVTPEYLRWYLNLPAVQGKLAGQARGSHVPTVGIQAFAELSVPLLPLAEQERTVEIDLLLQRERELTERLLEKRGRLAQAVLSRTLTNEEKRSG